MPRPSQPPASPSRHAPHTCSAPGGGQAAKPPADQSRPAPRAPDTITQPFPSAAEPATQPRLEPAAATPLHPVTVPAVRQADEAGLHILYIEDNPANVEVVARYLARRPGTTLHTATTGQDGLAYALAHAPGLILLDLHIPGIHGEQVLKELKAQPATAGIPIAILSADVSPGTIRRLRAAGAAAYLTKPLNLPELGLFLDAGPHPAAASNPVAAPAGTGQEPAAQVVLYIEDDPANIGLIQRALTQRPGIRLLTAGNAHDGLHTAAATGPALILLDNRLPDATGSQVLHQLAAHSATAATPVIIISGDTGRAAADTFLADGAAGFLPKPLDVHQLLSAIDNHLPPPATAQPDST